MDMRFRGNKTPGNPSGGLCDEYRIGGIGSLDELMAAYRRIAADHPACKPLFSLDDFRQACYTSGHARARFELVDITGLDPAGIPPECLQEGAYVGDMDTKAEFLVCAHGFARFTAQASFAHACGHGLTLDAQALEEWTRFQDDPIALLDQPVSALVVPADCSYDTLAAFPNGYFTCDLGPDQTYAVARHFCREHGYELIGIGASYLGLLRDAPPDAARAEAVADDVCALYNARGRERQALAAAVIEGIAGRTHLWLRYTE
ncbi:DUF4253 domain-containing protein [Bordetella genomosp. 13]|uniref:DUF4253 domain-containing protein n=1 Tax=Bordetella genomosp. 13 TaxID=463040 RepID=UPI0011A23CD6|nr:DUF4253 domain-containing protein [Bordetella genomosp. 13]